MNKQQAVQGPRELGIEESALVGGGFDGLSGPGAPPYTGGVTQQQWDELLRLLEEQRRQEQQVW